MEGVRIVSLGFTNSFNSIAECLHISNIFLYGNTFSLLTSQTQFRFYYVIEDSISFKILPTMPNICAFMIF